MGIAKSKKVLVALSGGVDSAVACATLKEQGYDVAGVFMRLLPADEPISANLKGNLSDVQKITDRLGVRLHIVDYSWEIQQIIDYFTYEYSVGRTPNPCARCNAVLKFGKLLAFARQLGAEFLATGHYARRVDHGGQRRLGRAVAREKDQSYVLFGIDRRDLPSLLFPNGEVARKDVIRCKARELALPVHDKEDSQEICFVPDDDYVAFLTRRQADLVRPGPIVDLAGKTIGEHQGVFQYTVGQRRGLRIAAGKPLYVIRIDPLTNTVVVGPREALARKKFVATQVNWHVDPPIEPLRVDAQIRYGHRSAPCRIETLTPGRIKVTFDKPQFAVTPGQAVVFYENDLVVGGGWIASNELS
jgi:tRNA-specific 2-thiouridylase